MSLFLELVQLHGVSRVLFGTDGPWADLSEEVAWIRGLPLAEEDREAIRGGNATKLLRLKKTFTVNNTPQGGYI